MPSIPPSSTGERSRILVITWLLAVLLAAYLIENLWVDSWLGAKITGWPGLVPEAESLLWLVAFALGGICCVVLVVCLVLVGLHRRISLRAKILTGLAVAGACVLWGLWFTGTSGVSAAAEQAKHSVTLTWAASTSPVTGYNVYRAVVKGREYVKINSQLVKQTSYKDESVESGKTYYYVTRAVDAKGKESVDSAEVAATVP
jgi:hypothetical protein